MIHEYEGQRRLFVKATRVDRNLGGDAVLGIGFRHLRVASTGSMHLVGLSSVATEHLYFVCIETSGSGSGNQAPELAKVASDTKEFLWAKYTVSWLSVPSSWSQQVVADFDQVNLAVNADMAVSASTNPPSQQSLTLTRRKVVVMDVPVDKVVSASTKPPSQQLVADFHCQPGAHGHGRARRQGRKCIKPTWARRSLSLTMNQTKRVTVTATVSIRAIS